MKSKEKKKTKNPEGRPPKFNSVEELMARFSQYIDYCAEERMIPTKAGLMLSFGLSRQGYNEYKNKPKFSDALREIEFAVEDAWLQQLAKSGVATGAIFYLKNAFHTDYRDKVETDITSNGEQLHVYIPTRK